MNVKYTIIYTIVSLVLFFTIIKYGTALINKCSVLHLSTSNMPILSTFINGKSNSCHALEKCKCVKEGLTNFENYSQKIIPYPKNSLINYNDTNSPLYSHTVNLPINTTYSCKNFCGPQSQCAITRNQCTADIDCPGCNPGLTPIHNCITKEVAPYDDAGKLGQQGLQYSNLTTGYNNHNLDFAQLYPDSKNAELQIPYQGKDLWTKSFNEGLNLYNKRRNNIEKYSQDISNQIPLGMSPVSNQLKYPIRTSATGQFYETTAPPSNASLQLHQN